MKVHKLLPLLILLLLVAMVLWLIAYSQIDWLEDDVWYQKLTNFIEAANNSAEQPRSCWSIPVHQLYLLQGAIIALIAAMISYGLLLFAKRPVFWSLAVLVGVFGLYWFYEKSQFCLNWMSLL